MRWMVTAVVVLATTGAAAQESDVKRPTTVISCEEELIYGTLQQPAGEVVTAPSPKKHKSMVKPRRNFRREMLGSLHQL